MRLYQLLEDIDVEKTVHQMGDKLISRFASDSTIDDNTDPSTFIEYIRDEVDPTNNNQYTLWVLRTYIKGGIVNNTDFSNVHVALLKFHQVKQQLPEKDINRIKQFSHLEELIDHVESEISGKEQKRQKYNEIMDDTKIFYSGPEGKIVIPESQESSCFWGKNTKWCTAYTKSDNYYNKYTSSGELYIILPNDGTKWQLHPHTGEFLDERNEMIDPLEWVDTYPWAAKALHVVYPEIYPLSTLRNILSAKDFTRELSDAVDRKNLPPIEGISGKSVILSTWDSLSDLLDEVDYSEYLGVPTEFDVDFVDIAHHSPSFDKLVLSKLHNTTRKKLIDNNNIVDNDEAVSAAVMENPDMIAVIAKFVWDHFMKSKNTNETPIIVTQLITAFTNIILSIVDETEMEFRITGDKIELIMDLDTFIDKLDNSDSVNYYDGYESENTFSVTNYDGWLSHHMNDEVFDEIMDGDQSDIYGDDVAIIKKQNSIMPNNITVTTIGDHETTDMFGDKPETPINIVEVPEEVIDYGLRQLDRSLNIYEGKSFKEMIRRL